MAIVTVKVERHFVGGALAGLTIPQSWREDAEHAPKVGTTRIVPKPYGSSPYRDKVISVEPAH